MQTFAKHWKNRNDGFEFQGTAEAPKERYVQLTRGR